MLAYQSTASSQGCLVGLLLSGCTPEPCRGAPQTDRRDPNGTSTIRVAPEPNRKRVYLRGSSRVPDHWVALLVGAGIRILLRLHAYICLTFAVASSNPSPMRRSVLSVLLEILVFIASAHANCDHRITHTCWAFLVFLPFRSICFITLNLTNYSYLLPRPDTGSYPGSQLL